MPRAEYKSYAMLTPEERAIMDEQEKLARSQYRGADVFSAPLKNPDLSSLVQPEMPVAPSPVKAPPTQADIGAAADTSVDGLERAQLAELNRERSMGNVLAKLPIDTGVDLSPLMALANSHMARNQQVGYEYKPTGVQPKDATAILMDYQNRLRKGQQDLLESVSRKKQAQADRTALHQQGINARKLMTDAQKSFKNALDKTSELDSLDAALASGDSRTIKMHLAQAARALSGEKGVLTDPDVQRVFTSTLETDIDGVVAYLTSSSSQIPTKLLEPLKEAAKIARARIERNHRAEIAGIQAAGAYLPGAGALNISGLTDPFLKKSTVPSDDDKVKEIVDMLEKVGGDKK